MSDLSDKITEDIKASMKAGEKERLLVLRSLMAEIKNATVNAGKDMTDEAVVSVVAKAIKQRADAYEQFTQAGREDLASKEEAEMAILKEFQPEQLSEEEITALVDEAIAATGAATKKEMGKVMGFLMPKVKGKADGSIINKIVGSKLS